MAGQEVSPRTLAGIVVSTKPRAVVAGPDLFSTLPNIDESFAALDARYMEDRSGYLGELPGTVEELPGYPGLVVSILADDRVADSTKLGIMKAPLDSTHPQSTPFAAASYAQKESPGFWEQQRVRPNTWNEIGKLGTNYEIATQQGVGMPMATIYSPVPKELFSKEELDQIKAGDTSPWGRIFQAVADRAQEKLHGKDGATQFEELYLFEPGMGHEAVGAAHYLQAHDEDRQVKALITPNLITGVKNKWALLSRYSVRATFGEASDFEPQQDYLSIPEPMMRLELDKKGAEFAMRRRQVRAILGLFSPGAMVHSDWLEKTAMPEVVENGTAFVVPVGVHANITRDTIRMLPHDHPNFWLLPIVAIKDQYADLGVNENYSLGAVEFVEGVLFADDLGKIRDQNGSKV